MSHQALYRRFRSKTFDEIIGQKFIVQTLKNQIITGNIAHAYLFCGIRGTGKTSLAKIMARAVNCQNSHDGNPCNECEICKSILDETNIDVIEMDAASNNGVDDIRDIRDKVRFLPANSKYKVYIIDEVHMLSKSAFNALLKTLEEPPSHMIFILATTEPQKIPATVLSRCQRFDLKRISLDEIVENMKNICNITNTSVDDEALKLIAYNADGSMRDALSILDRCMTFNSEKISYDDVNELLGSVRYDKIASICQAIINKDIKDVMTSINTILNAGKDLQLLAEEILMCFRNVLVYKSTGSVDNLLSINAQNLKMISEISEKLSIDSIVKIIKMLSELLVEQKKSINPRIIFETGIIRVMESIDLDYDTLEKRIAHIEEILKSGKKISIAANVNKSQESKISSKIDTYKSSEVKKSNSVEMSNEADDLNKSNKVEKASDNQEMATKHEALDDVAAEKMLREHWNDFLKNIRSENVALLAIVRESTLAYVKNKVVCFEYDDKFDFHYTAANKEKNKSRIKFVVSNFLGAPFEVNFKKSSENVEEGQSTENSSLIDDVYNDMKNALGEDKVSLK